MGVASGKLEEGVCVCVSQAQMIPPHDSLVKYDNPILVSTTKEKSGKKKKTAALPPVERSNTQTEDILNSILPPRECAGSVQCDPPSFDCGVVWRFEKTVVRIQTPNKTWLRNALTPGLRIPSRFPVVKFKTRRVCVCVSDRVSITPHRVWCVSHTRVRETVASQSVSVSSRVANIGETVETAL